VWFIDLLDIAVLAILIYQLLLILQRTRATQLIMGILYFAGVFAVAYFLRMTATLWVFERLVIVVPMALLILFQPELRSFLERAGRRGFFGRISYTDRETIENVLQTVVQALEEMSEDRTGALIVLEKDVDLHDYVYTGERIDANVRKDLLKAIFHKGNPLHDGAVIIRGGKILSARSFLPLSESHELPPHLGARHRAAMGITEVSDAVSLVASEETGHLSLFYGGKPAFRLTPGTMLQMVESIFLPEVGGETPLTQFRENLSRLGQKEGAGWALKSKAKGLVGKSNEVLEGGGASEQSFKEEVKEEEVKE